MKEKTVTKGESTSKRLIGNSTKMPSQDGSSFIAEMVPIKLFVGGLSWQTTADKLKEYFGQFGNITDVLVLKDPLTQRNRGFGFVTFSNADALGRVAAVPTHTLDGKKIDPKPATPKGKTKALKPTKVFVGGVSQDSNADEVKAYFSQFGNVRETVMLMDQQTRRHRGFGFITFDSEEAVDRVCEIHFHVIKDKKVECKKAQSKEAAQAKTYMSNNLLLNVGRIPSLGMPAAMQSMPGQIVRGTAIQSVSGHRPPAAMQSLPGFTPHTLLHHHPHQLTTSHFPASYGKLLNANGHPNYRYSPYSLPVFMPPPAGTAPPPQGAPPLPPTAIQLDQVMNSAIGVPPPPHTAMNLASGVPPPPLKAIQSNQTTNSLSGAPPQTPTAPSSYEQLATRGTDNAQIQYSGYHLANVDMTAFGNVDWSSMVLGFPGLYY